MNKYEKELFEYCIEDDFNPDGVQVAIMDAYDKGFGRGLLIGSACTFIGLIAIGLCVSCANKRKKHALK